MKKFKGTPGPWIVRSQEFQSVGTGEKMTAICYGIENANLIAAAPELLEALQDMLSGWKYIRAQHGELYGVGWDRSEQKAIAAIEKALGE